jgi:DNA-binding transcriptional LysR family regulator
MKKSNTLATLPNIEAFCLAFEANSFTKAASMIGLTPQALSRAVARLEASLGVTLFRRTTRQLHPTDQGRSYYEACRQAITVLADAEQQLSKRQKNPTGKVRISAPTTYGHHRLLPSLAEFCREFPEVEVEVNISNRNIDFVQEGYDLAIRMGVIQDKTFVSRCLGDFTLGIFASPEYLKGQKAPASLDELQGHRCIVFLLPRTGRVLPWEFSVAPKQYTPRQAYQVSDDALGLITLARAGVGLIQTYHFLVEQELSRGELVEVLPALGGSTRRFSLLYPKAVAQTRASRVLLDFILSHLA